jgi:hypothetical protein
MLKYEGRRCHFEPLGSGCRIRKGEQRHTNITTPSTIALIPGLEAAWQDVEISFDRFCLVAGIGALEQVLREDAQRLTGPRHGGGRGRVGHHWGMTKG